MVAPHLVEQLAARKHALRMGQQEFQQLVLGMADIDLLFIHHHRAADGVQRDVAGAHGRLRVFRTLASQQGLGPGQQLARRERLGDVIVGAAVQAGQLVFFHALGGEHDDGDGGEIAVGADARQQAQARLVRQHPVQQDQMRRAVLDEFPGIGDVLYRTAIPAGFAQRIGHQFNDGRLIFNNQYRGFIRCHKAYSGSSSEMAGAATLVWRMSLPSTT